MLITAKIIREKTALSRFLKEKRTENSFLVFMVINFFVNLRCLFLNNKIFCINLRIIFLKTKFKRKKTMNKINFTLVFLCFYCVSTLKLSYRINFTCNVYFTATLLPLCSPGFHRGISLITLRASLSSSLLMPFITLISLMLPSLSTIKLI